MYWGRGITPKNDDEKLAMRLYHQKYQLKDGMDGRKLYLLDDKELQEKTKELGFVFSKYITFKTKEDFLKFITEIFGLELDIKILHVHFYNNPVFILFFKNDEDRIMIELLCGHSFAYVQK